MVTDNFYKYMLKCGTENVQKGKNYLGNEVTIGTPSGSQPGLYSCLNSYYEKPNYYSHFSFGDGDITPTKEDFNLSGNFITGLTVSKTLESTESSWILKATITNNNADSVVIKEIGLFGLVNSGYVSSCLMDRTVLDTPVTIPAGGIGQVVYTITFNYPTAT